MLVRFYTADKSREINLAKALEAGALVFGDKTELVDSSKYSGPLPDTDVACCFGVKGFAAKFIRDHHRAGKRSLFFDKGFVRSSMGGPTGYTRVSLDGFMPFPFLDVPHTEDRWKALNMPLLPPRAQREGDVIVVAGSSQKYCDFHNLGDANGYFARLVRIVKENTGSHLPIIYRPKPSWTEYVPIENTTLSRPPETLASLLPRTRLLVTHGSHAAVDAVIAGVPVLVWGPGIMKPISVSELSSFASPEAINASKRLRLLKKMANWQWKLSEIQSGAMWEYIRKCIFYDRNKL